MTTYTTDTANYLQAFRNQSGKLPTPEALVKMRKASTVDDAKQILLSFEEGRRPEVPSIKEKAPSLAKGVKSRQGAGGEIGRMTATTTKDDTVNIQPVNETVNKSRLDHRWVRNILRWAFLVVGIAAAIRSATIVFSYFGRLGWSDFESWLMVGVITGMSTIGPVAVELMWQQVRRGKNIVLFAVIILASGFSMYTGVNVTIGELSATRAEVSDVVLAEQAVIDMAKGNLADAEARIAEIKAQIASLQSDKDLLRDELQKHEPASAAYNRVYWRIAELEKSISALSKEGSRISDTLPGLREATSKTVETSKTHDTETMGYGLAGLLEIAGPLCLAVWAFL